MWFMTCIVYLGTFLQISFLTLGLAAALYYLAELVEEFSTIARRAMYFLVA
uniref:Protein TEX261 n=1 Tax=Plectus sambesii TaxID=2011161 RepID=A0A914XJP1_9BILA